MPDALFEVPRLAAIYDVFDGDRADLDAYAAMAREFGAREVLEPGAGGIMAAWGTKKAIPSGTR